MSGQATVTHVEKIWLEDLQQIIPGVTAETHMDIVRSRIRTIAFHEAGHGAAHAFIGQDYTHFNGLSVIPTSATGGRLTLERISFFWLQDDTNSPDLRPMVYTHAKSAIIKSMAGLVAEAMASNDPEEYSGPLYLETYADSGSWIEMSEEEWMDRDDMGRCWKYAAKIESPAWPAHRWINTLEGWTREMFAIPEVWAVTERLAQKLIDRGEITDFEEYDEIVSPILYWIFKRQPWTRRIIGTRRKAANQ